MTGQGTDEEEGQRKGDYDRGRERMTEEGVCDRAGD